MNKIKLLTLLSALLIIINLALIAFIFMNKPGPRKFRKHPREIFNRRLIHQLEFDDVQIGQFTEIAESHRSKHEFLSGEINLTRKKLYQELGNENQTPQLLKELDSLNALREAHVWNFTSSVYAICNDRQKEKFKARIINPRRRGRRHF